MTYRNFGFSPTNNSKTQAMQNSKNSERASLASKLPFAWRMRTFISIRLMRYAGWLAIKISPWLED